MKLTKKDIGVNMAMGSWHRGLKSDDELKCVTVDKVGRVNITLSGTSYRIVKAGEFSIMLSRGHYSDHWVKIYRQYDDVAKDLELNRLSSYFSSPCRKVSRKIESLTLDQLKRMESIVNEK